MKKIVGIVGTLVTLASAAPAALADVPCDTPESTYVEPAPTYVEPAPTYVEPAPTYVQPTYAPDYVVAPPAPVYAPARYNWRYRIWEARRAEMMHRRWEAYRRWRYEHDHRFHPFHY